MILIPRLRTFHQLIVGILLVWILTFLWHERILPFYTARSCHWELDSSTNILLVADPQLIDNHTYPGRNKLLLKLSQHTVDTYIKKNYKFLVNLLTPHYIFFLGDYLDNGRSIDDDYFSNQVLRFNHVFPNENYGYEKGSSYFVNVPGNHDIGIGNDVNLEHRDRFDKVFGERNSVLDINGVEFISLDTLSLMSEKDEINGDVKSFLSQYPLDKPKNNPRILLSHVPLYRDPEQQTCGPLRESDTFIISKGYKYQLVVDLDISQNLLDRIQPDIIFSGDDHDYCDINHNVVSREITVKSISMAMGIWKPAVQILSFTNDQNSGDFEYKTKMCYLPTPYYNIINYIILSVITGLILLYWNYNRSPRLNYNALPLHNMNARKLSNFLKLQDEGSDEIISNVPNYTTPKQKTSRFSRLKGKFGNLKTTIKKLHFTMFLKHSGIMSLMVIFIYIVFYKTI